MAWRQRWRLEFDNLKQTLYERRGSFIPGLVFVLFTIVNAGLYDHPESRNLDVSQILLVTTLLLGIWMLAVIVMDFTRLTMNIRLITYNASLKKVTAVLDCDTAYQQSLEMIRHARKDEKELIIITRTDEIIDAYGDEFVYTVFRRGVGLIIGLATLAVILAMLETNLEFLAQHPIFQGLDPQASFWEQLFVVFMSLVSLAGFGSFLPSDVFGYLLLALETLVGITFFVLAINIMLATIINEVENTRQTIRMWLTAEAEAQPVPVALPPAPASVPPAQP